ncbi:purine-binding chemotaxis protein CheW [Carboxylicivirga sediminis]|uniref:Purine-binding chemotaxis protein CheW n=1 Tax=Carboxylicivirga sediminis TaxID=2006564 RepID=A0A941F557_9BACT|nr:chemotaxis protein CheW [Carboxylicivirga sediminis]MBR8537048.1 purine-binding chemotaxis protein CheW [Carboxylicivirga sediminis]
MTSIISFLINGEVFAFDTLKVRNILEFDKVTWVPNTKKYLLGVINLHGNIIPIADLRMMMGTENAEIGQDTAIIVVSDDDKTDSLIGLVVDGVKEVFDLDEASLKESVINGNTGLVHTFTGSIFKNDEFIHIIDLSEVVQEIEK